MAVCWFNYLEKLSKDKQEELKVELAGQTLIGEFIGAQEHQHLVKYSRVTIIFYAIVENNSSEDCWPCDKAWTFFNKWGLDKVHI